MTIWISRRGWIWALSALALVAGCGRAEPAPPAAKAPVLESAWLQVTDRGPEARLITAAATCPDAKVDGKALPMTARVGPNADFPVTVCQVVIPAGAKHVAIGNAVLPLPIATPKRLVIFGDTGCRLKGADIQDCDKPTEWPFAVVARLAAAHHPDLVIHVGDYYYRESPCPAGRAGCAGSPWGDNWTTWDADFFEPARPLLTAAPWLIVRGNHEDCNRGGPGWFRLLDNGASPLACPATSAPMVVKTGGLEFYVLDSSNTDDRNAPDSLVAQFETQLDALKATPPDREAWIITHRPIWGLTPVAKVGPVGPLEVALNATEQAAVKARSLAGVEMVVSGHIHHFASFSFQGRRPSQLIVGTGGDVGEPADSPRFIQDTVSLDGMSASRLGFDRYGFLVLDRAGAGWTGVFYNVHDEPVADCKITGRTLACAPHGH